MGAGSFDLIELRKALTGKVASAEVSIGELFERVYGSASPQDLETMFQLLYLRFTGARRNEEAFRAYYTNTLGRLQNQQASPEWWFNKKMSETLSRDHPRRRPLTVETLEQLELDRALAVYRERFADASDFRFTIVGNFSEDSIRPLVETWLGGLPATNRRESWRDPAVEPPLGVERFEVRKGIEPKSRVEVHFHGEAPWSPLEEHLIDSMADVLRIRLRELLREDLGGVYGVRVSGNISHYPRQRYRVTISFGCDPARVDELVAVVMREIDALKSEGPDPSYVDKVREAQKRERETDLERNGFWADALTGHEIDGTDPREILRYDEMIAAVNVRSVQEAATRYLDTSRYVQGVLLPVGDVSQTPASGTAP
jgi:zinc protease